MGLDMFLTKKTTLRGSDRDLLKLEYPNIKSKRVCEIVEEILYWRKVNAVHNWFVVNVQEGEDEDDCREYLVSTWQLDSLLMLIEAVLESPELAPILLPTRSGFFFGGTEYNEYYFVNLRWTVKKLKDILLEDNSNAEFYYRSSW